VPRRTYFLEGRGRLDLTISIGGLKLKTPLIIASGVFSLDSKEKVDESFIGAIVTKTVTWSEREGNPPPRLCETYSGLLNSIGLQNPGVSKFILQLETFKLDVPLVGSVGGESVEEYTKVAEKLSHFKFIALEINVSCPNVRRGGMAFGKDPKVAREVVKCVKEVTSLPVWVKLTPESDVVKVAEVVREEGADALVVANTYPGLSVDVKGKRPLLGAGYGGLSGPAIKPLNLRLLRLIKENVDIPVIGCGGIFTERDALEYLICGASAVQIGTAFLIDSLAPARIFNGLRKYLQSEGINSIQEIINTLRF
jgi:dihydroorotate dehydrogenase (NAD+) catalytic subunit